VAVPWTRFLPDDEKAKFVHELIEVMSAGEQGGFAVPVLQTITDWRHTADVYADPELLEILGSQTIEDAGDVPAPPADR
jgi:hypothetical protein